MVGAALPKEFKIDVTNVKQLKIISSGKEFGYGEHVGFANVISH